jgi:hypothetical protein
MNDAPKDPRNLEYFSRYSHTWKPLLVSDCLQTLLDYNYAVRRVSDQTPVNSVAQASKAWGQS